VLGACNAEFETYWFSIGPVYDRAFSLTPSKRALAERAYSGLTFTVCVTRSAA
jgi:hypothetical protein